MPAVQSWSKISLLGIRILFSRDDNCARLISLLIRFSTDFSVIYYSETCCDTLWCMGTIFIPRFILLCLCKEPFNNKKIWKALKANNWRPQPQKPNSSPQPQNPNPNHHKWEEVRMKYKNSPGLTIKVWYIAFLVFWYVVGQCQGQSFSGYNSSSE